MAEPINPNTLQVRAAKRFVAVPGKAGVTVTPPKKEKK